MTTLLAIASLGALLLGSIILYLWREVHYLQQQHHILHHTIKHKDAYISILLQRQPTAADVQRRLHEGEF